jgi:hypothetical protein
MARSGSSCLPSAGTSRTASGREADVGESSAVSAPKTPRCPGVGSAPYRRRWDRGKPAGARPGTTTGRRAHGRPAPFEAPEAAHRPGVQRHVQQGGRSRRTARRPPPGCCAPASRVASVPAGRRRRRWRRRGPPERGHRGRRPQRRARQRHWPVRLYRSLRRLDRRGEDPLKLGDA